MPTSVLAWETNVTEKECWATDAAQKDGSTYFYVSVGPTQIGVLKGASATGPFVDPRGTPLIPEGLVPTKSRDPAVFTDGTSSYLIWGTFSYFVAKLSPNMSSLAEAPRAVIIRNQQHRDDKPRGIQSRRPNLRVHRSGRRFVHVNNGTYYLSWGAASDALTPV